MNKCPICKSNDTVKVRMHFYQYRKCNGCKHVYNCAEEKAIKKQYIRLQDRKRKINREIIQDTLTYNHLERRKVENQERFFPLKNYAPDAQSVLEIDCQDGTFQELLDKDVEYRGLTIDSFYRNKLSDNAMIGNLSNLDRDEEFDAIIICDHLEFAFDPFSDLMKCLSKIKKQGTIIAIIKNGINPSEDYRAMAHCFSYKSACLLGQAVTKNIKIYKEFEKTILVMKN